MNLAVGIVGLPNVGKSTLFNALSKKQLAYAANFPFATIEPNIGVVPVPDIRLSQLAEIVKTSENMTDLPPLVPATVEFVDIAGLIARAHKGEGLGNKFLSHIREVDAICHVVRNFKDENIIREGAANPKSDLEVIETELMMADLATLEKQREPNKSVATKEDKYRWEAVLSFINGIKKATPIRNIMTEENAKYANEMSLLTAKPILVVLNSDEEDLKNADALETDFAKKVDLNNNQIIVVNAKLEEELAGLSEEDQKEYLSEQGLEKNGLERVIQKAFSTLGLITFLTAGVKEVRAWTIKEGITAQEASGVIHTDFIKHFIKADIVSLSDFLKENGWKKARENGEVRQEGRDYIVSDGDVIEFKIGQ